MFDNKINVKGVHVELSTERTQYVLRHIGPLLRLTDDPSGQMDVIIRSIRRPLTGTVCCVMVRYTGAIGTHYAVSMSPFFTRAVREARDEMRRTLSRTHTPEISTIQHMRREAHERYFVELFV